MFFCIAKIAEEQMMSRSSIYFHSQNISFTPKKKNALRLWLQDVAIKEKVQINEVNFIFCNDENLLQLNETYLNHNTYTDIITFDYSEHLPLYKSSKKNQNSLTGDIFISIDRVKENAQKFDTLFENELHRVMVHGILHLIGYKDKSKKDKKLMTQKENFYLSFNNF